MVYPDRLMSLVLRLQSHLLHSSSPKSWKMVHYHPQWVECMAEQELQVVVLGRAGGKLETGRVLDYTGKPDRQMCRLYLSLMEKMGVREKAFGDATAPLEEV